jgi:hypothetical protein
MKKIITIFIGFLFSLHGFSQSWLLTGNAGTNSSTNFVGTTDTQRLVFRTNNVERATITSAGNVGIGISNPALPLHIFSNTADNFLRLSGTGPSIQFISGTTTTRLGKLAFSSGPAEYVGTSVAGDFILQNLDTAGSLIFGTNHAANGLERMRITSSGYVGIATTTPTAKLDINCVAVSGKTNPSNIRFENLQSGAGTILVIDSNGYVFKAASGASASVAQATPLSTDLQAQVENLKAQVQELRSLLSNRLQLTPAQLNSLNAETSTWLGDNKPNPASGSTIIEYSLPAGVMAASCQVYSLDGKMINSIPLSPASGKGTIQVGTNKLSSGMYIYSLIINGKVADTKKMVVNN